MKIKVSLFIISAVLMLTSGEASAAFPHFTPNQFKTAESLDPGMTQTGIDFSIGSGIKNYYADIRYGLGAMVELGAKLGASSMTIDSEDKAGALVGIDLKYQLIKEAEGIPLDLALDLGFDNIILNRKNASELTLATIISKDFPLTDRGYKLIPYGGLAMSILYGSLPDENDAFLNVFAGLEWKLSQRFMILLEIEGGERTMGGAGIRFEY